MSHFHVSGLALAAVDTVPRYHDQNPRLASALRLNCDARVQKLTASECPGHTPSGVTPVVESGSRLTARIATSLRFPSTR